MLFHLCCALLLFTFSCFDLVVIPECPTPESVPCYLIALLATSKHLSIEVCFFWLSCIFKLICCTELHQVLVLLSFTSGPSLLTEQISCARIVSVSLGSCFRHVYSHRGYCWDGARHFPVCHIDRGHVVFASAVLWTCWLQSRLKPDLSLRTKRSATWAGIHPWRCYSSKLVSS